MPRPFVSIVSAYARTSGDAAIKGVIKYVNTVVGASYTPSRTASRRYFDLRDRDVLLVVVFTINLEYSVFWSSVRMPSIFVSRSDLSSSN